MHQPDIPIQDLSFDVSNPKMTAEAFFGHAAKAIGVSVDRAKETFARRARRGKDEVLELLKYGLGFKMGRKAVEVMANKIMAYFKKDEARAQTTMKSLRESVI